MLICFSSNETDQEKNDFYFPAFPRKAERSDCFLKDLNSSFVREKVHSNKFFFMISNSFTKASEKALMDCVSTTADSGGKIPQLRKFIIGYNEFSGDSWNKTKINYNISNPFCTY